MSLSNLVNYKGKSLSSEMSPVKIFQLWPGWGRTAGREGTRANKGAEETGKTDPEQEVGVADTLRHTQVKTVPCRPRWLVPVISALRRMTG